MKRTEILFVGLLVCVVPPTLYLMSNTTRYENNEITCLAGDDIFKLSYDTLSVNATITFENQDTQIQLAVNAVSSGSFLFSDNNKTYTIDLETSTALVIEDGVNEIFNCTHEVFKM